jgi:hypothetical protein
VSSTHEKTSQECSKIKVSLSSIIILCFSTTFVNQKNILLRIMMEITFLSYNADVTVLSNI